MQTAHIHFDLEINLVISGSIDYFLAGRFLRLQPGQIVTFWAGIPHQVVAYCKQTEACWVTVPLPWFMQWSLPDKIRECLLSGEILIEENCRSWHQLMFMDWAENFQGSSERRKITTLEVEALLRRMAEKYPGYQHTRAHISELVTRISRYVGEHYQKLDHLGQIASALKMHPNYLTQAFAKATRMSLWDYVIRLRIAHAQRLLLMSDLSVIEVAFDSGFSSVSRFHAAFQKYCHSTPRRFRQSYSRGVSR
ncbi:MAG: helix-turn-helix domain-containing protein [Verrucomicrobiota bacterium]